MRAKYPKPRDYREIYARYYDGRTVAELCAHLKDLKNKRCLDLCSGDGVVTEYLFVNGAEDVWSVDESKAMLRAGAHRNPRAHPIHSSVETMLAVASTDNRRFDKVICRQGVNYWFTIETIQLLSCCMDTGSMFVFNTFNQKPSTHPRVRHYVLNDTSYSEMAYSVGDTIHTVVACEGHEPHQSEIRWLSREFLHNTLRLYFDVMEHVDGNASVYVCTRI